MTSDGSPGRLNRRHSTRDAASAAARTRASARVTRRDIDDAVARYRDLLETADQAERTQLIDAVASAESTSGSAGRTDLDVDLFGRVPTGAETAAAEIGQLQLGFERRREVISASLTREAAAKLLHVTGQEVLDHLHSGELVGLRDGKRWLLPLWQFDADCERGFLPGIAAVSRTFPGGVVSLSRWVTTAHPDFGDRSPRQAMAAGRVDEVAAAAAALTSAGW